MFTYFGDFIGISAEAFDYAVSTSEGLQPIAESLFTGRFPLKNRNTGLFVKEIEALPDWEVRVLVANNKGEEAEHRLIFYW